MSCEGAGQRGEGRKTDRSGEAEVGFGKRKMSLLSTLFLQGIF